MKTVRLLLAGLVLALGLGAGAWAADGWTAWRDDAYGVASSFPGTPTVRYDDDQPRPTMRAVFASSDDQAYAVAVDWLDDPKVDKAKLLDLAVAGALDGAESPLVSRRSLDIDGAVATELVVGPSAENLYGRVWIILKDDRLIMVLESKRGEAPPLDPLFTDLVVSAPQPSN